MPQNKNLEDLLHLFSDAIHYESDDPFSVIDPSSYRTPEGDTLLHIAATRGDCRAIEILLDGGAEIDAVGDMGSTALHYASSAGHRHAFDLLIERGADPSIRNEFQKISGVF